MTFTNDICNYNVKGLAAASGDGIYINNGKNITISGCNCSANAQNGIYIYDDSINGTLINNTCSQNGINGIYLSYIVNYLVANNTCRLNTKDGILIDAGFGPSSTFNSIINNTCLSSVHSNGIELNTAYNSTLSNNTCLFNYNGTGILFTACSNDTLSWNNCSSDLNGISVNNDTNDFLNANILTNNTIGIYILWGSNILY